MNRKNFIGHLVLAVLMVSLAALVGQVRRSERMRHESYAPREHVAVLRDAGRAHEEEEVVSVEGEPEVLVRFRPGVSEEKIKAIASNLNDRVEDNIESVGGLVALDDLDGENVEEVIADYSRLPEVEYVEENDTQSFDDPRAVSGIEGRFMPSVSAGPNDPLLSEQWALVNVGQRGGREKADIDALGAWTKTQGSDRVVVAVLDSGVDYTHPDLINNMWLRPASLAPYADTHLGEVDDSHGFNAVENNADPMDDNGHGTHCAGIVGAEGNNDEGITGVNWKVEIMPLKFMGAGGTGTTKDAIEAINYVIARKKAGVNVRVISASWGSTRKSRALEDVIRKAGEEGILFIAASGNSTANTDRNPHYPSSYNLPNVISVAALNRRDELAGFSNFGAKSVHVAAPGAEIMSTWLDGEYEEHSGTSMATPVVSGIAALVLSIEPGISLPELRTRLLDSVDNLDSLKGKVASGGRINAARAVGASGDR